MLSTLAMTVVLVCGLALGGCQNSARTDAAQQPPASPDLGGTASAEEIRSGEQPTLDDDAPIVRFGTVDVGPQEAWEIVEYPEGVYLNYFRFPYGDTSYQGLPTQVCFGVVAKRKYVGVGENRLKLQKALRVTALAKSTEDSASFSCRMLSEIFQENSKNRSLKFFFDSIR